MSAEDEIRALDQQWCCRFKAGDADWIIDLFASDGRLLLPDMPPVTGRQSLAEVWNALISDPDLQFVWQADAVTVATSEDLASVTGSAQLTTSEGVKQGKYVVVWVKQENQWKVLLDMFNTN